MGKFKWIAILLILVLLMSPVAILFLPSFSTKIQPALNLMGALTGPGAEENIQLGSFSFIGSDNDSLLLGIELVITNTAGGDMLFPSINLTFSYGSTHLGDGWVHPAVLIPSGEAGTIPIYAKMQKGDAFNMFLLSLIGGGLSLDISGGEAFLFLDTFGGSSAGVISIPLPSIPLPAMDMGGASFWPPTIHRVYRGEVAADTPVEVTANVTDKGGGVKTVILSWTNGTRWENVTMEGLPLKPIFGGPSTFLGGLLSEGFKSYPPSCIPTTWSFGIARGEIPAQPANTNVSYRLYVIDDFNYVTLVPSTNPTYMLNMNETIDNETKTFNYTVPTTTPLSNYTAVWLPTTGGAGGGGLADLLDSLSASGIDIFGAIMQGSSAFAALSGGFNVEALTALVYGLLVPLIEYLQLKHVNPFEVLDQLLGISGGIPGLDATYRANANMTLALDLLAEGGVGLVDLINLLDVDMSKVVDALGNSIKPPLAEGETLREALYVLLNQTFNDPVQNESFFNMLKTHDLYYFNKSMMILKEDGLIWVNYTLAQTYSLEGNASTNYYFGSICTKDLLGTIYPGENFTIIDFDFLSPGEDPNLGTKYHWEYFNGTWEDLPDLANGDKTQNFTKAGRIFFAPPSNMVPVAVGPDSIKTNWIRLTMDATINETVPIVNATHISVDYIPYYFNNKATDPFGRPTSSIIPGVTDSFLHLLQNMNENNSYAMMIWSLLSARGITYSEFIEEIGGTYLTIQSPVTKTEILSMTSPFLGMIVYGVLLIAVIAAIRGRKPPYAISPIRIKKWYESMTVGPSLKKKEEFGKIKETPSPKDERY